MTGTHVACDRFTFILIGFPCISFARDGFPGKNSVAQLSTVLGFVNTMDMNGFFTNIK